MSNQLFYSDESLDRSHLLRKDPVKIDALLQSNDTIFVAHAHGKSLFSVKGSVHISVQLNLYEIDAIEHQNTLFLGFNNNQAVFGIDLTNHNEDIINDLFEAFIFDDVRKHITSVSSKDASMMAYVKGMFTWHQNHLYCGKCGAETHSISAGHERQCSNVECKNIQFPRIDPAVIVLIQYTFPDGLDRCLLGRSNRFASNMYSTLAGFVEPGESLEMTVKREMMEEAGIEVQNIQYIASQPWSFPSSIMLGFFADAITTELNLDTDEVVEANWFTAQELIKKSASGEIILSREDSIANFLIKKWIADQTKKHDQL
jgi:NAD+ diphosphatase